MRKKLAMVVLGLGLAVGAPAANDLFPATAAQTVEVQFRLVGSKNLGIGIFTKTVQNRPAGRPGMENVII